MKKLFVLLLIVLIGINTPAFSQHLRATNIFYRIIGNDIEIFYDLPANKDTLNVEIYFHKRSSPTTNHKLKWVNGHIGIGVFSGRKQKVTWHYKKEPSHLFTGSGFYFEIVAKKSVKLI